MPVQNCARDEEEKMSLEDLRRQYTLGGLDEANVPDDPIELFGEWMQAALDNSPADWVEPYAMTVATASPTGDVSSRIVLLRDFDQKGFVFYTNYESHKGEQLAANAVASLMFYWGYLERQVRIRGAVTRISRELSEMYFHKRPRRSQIGAAVSRQSKPIPDRETFEAAVSDLTSKLGDAPVPLPDFWGGYCVEPKAIEFWQGRENRMHDRVCYSRQNAESAWNRQRLSP